jgi:hypothetical protein
VSKKNSIAVSLALLCAILLAACSGSASYSTTFDENDNWAVGSDGDVDGAIVDGRYEMLVKQSVGQFWTTAGENLSDGIYQVETTQLEGDLDAGYGMVYRLNTNDNQDSFYLFEISSDGYAFIARCENNCASRDETINLIDQGWFTTPLINQGLNATNVLRVKAEGGNMIFSINGSEVGRASDSELRNGDIGLMVETIGFPGIKVAFDNFTVDPLE